MSALWTDSPQAQALLASCVANPPAATFHAKDRTRRGVEMDREGLRFDEADRRVVALKALWDAATDLTHCPSKADAPAAWHAFREAWGLQYELTVDAAIQSALNAVAVNQALAA